MAVKAKPRRPRINPGVILREREDTWPLQQLCRLLPCKPSYGRLWRWCAYGRSHPYTRTIVQMEAISGADGMESSVEAFARFIQRLNEG